MPERLEPRIKASAGISIVLYGNAIEEVTRAVGQVLATDCDFQLVLVDNSQPALPLPEFADPRVIVIRAPRNLGYGAGHNLGMMYTASRPYHFVLNADLRFGPEVIPAMISYLEDNPDVGLAMPKVIYPDGRLQHLCRLLPSPIDLLGRGFSRRSQWVAARNNRYENRNWSYDRPAQFPFLSGCFMALRREIVDRIEGFDERFFLYGEDLDLSRRMHTVARTMFAPVAIVVHEYRSEERPSHRLTRYKLVSLARYFAKWGWFFDLERHRINRETIKNLDT